MDTILITTDFTTVSHNAAVFGTSLARFYKAKVILLNVLINTHGIKAASHEYNAVLSSDQRLLEEAERLDPAGTLVDVLCDKGQTMEAIITLANEKRVNLIVTGLKKNVPGRQVSTCLLLSKHTTRPVLMIPESAVFEKFSQLVFIQLNGGSGARQRDQLAKLSAAFGATISTVIADQAEIETFYTGQGATKMMSAPMFGGDVPAISNMAKVINNAINTQQADAIVMYDPSDEWLSATAQAAVPLIVLPA